MLCSFLLYVLEPNRYPELEALFQFLSLLGTIAQDVAVGDVFVSELPASNWSIRDVAFVSIAFFVGDLGWCFLDLAPWVARRFLSAVGFFFSDRFRLLERRGGTSRLYLFD